MMATIQPFPRSSVTLTDIGAIRIMEERSDLEGLSQAALVCRALRVYEIIQKGLDDGERIWMGLSKDQAEQVRILFI
jgi:hypothetical protein